MTGLTKRGARSLISRVIKDVYDAANALTELYEERAWEVLGYGDWAELCAAEFGALRELGRSERKVLVTSMTAHGMSQVAQATAAGVSRQTIQADQGAENQHPVRVVGLDGKTYTRTARTVPRQGSRPGATNWSQRVQRISADCPMRELDDEQLAELEGAAEYLFAYCKGESIRRARS